MVRMTFKSLFLLAVAFLSGCARQNVRPYFEAAINNFEAAQELEYRIVEAESDQQSSMFTTLFDQLERATLESPRVLLVSGWDSQANDFKEQSRTEAWAGWFGVAPRDEIPERELRIERMLLAEYLNETVTIDVKITTTGFVQNNEQIRMYDQFTKFKGKGLGGQLEPNSPADAQRLASEYAAWEQRFEDNILSKTPVYKAVLNAREAAIESVDNARARRLERTNLVYQNLISVAELGKEQAGTLTTHAGFIQIANRVFAVATKLVAGGIESPIAAPQRPK